MHLIDISILKQIEFKLRIKCPAPYLWSQFGEMQDSQAVEGAVKLITFNTCWKD